MSWAQRAFQVSHRTSSGSASSICGGAISRQRGKSGMRLAERECRRLKPGGTDGTWL